MAMYSVNQVSHYVEEKQENLKIDDIALTQGINKYYIAVDITD